MSKSAVALIALGTNLPFGGCEGPALLDQAVSAVAGAGLSVRATSAVWLSPAWPPGSAQPDFHNAVAALEPKDMNPQELYAVLRDVETQFGRERRERWGPRTLDLDILAMDGLAGDFSGIILPHPRLHERSFVLAPLVQVAPDWRHPHLGLTAGRMWELLPEVERARVRVVI